jgi:hypothetical protein
LIKPKSIKLLSAGFYMLFRKAMQNIFAEMTPLLNKYLTNEGCPSSKAPGFAVNPKMADKIPFVAAVPSSLLSPEV